MPGKILSQTSALNLRIQAKRKGLKIVFTNGCFDLLHRGHIEYLKRARSLGDILIVGLNSDASVRRLKGRGRPLQSQKDRAVILAALESVDYVVIFYNTTPKKLISRLKPDLLVKGADYQKDEIIGRKIVEKSGGKVVRLPLIRGRSTSNIIKRVAQLR